MVTRYQFRLSGYLWRVVITALVAASPRLITWIVRGRAPEYISVEIDGKPELSDVRVWLTHHLNPKNRPSPLTYAAPIGENGSTGSRAAPGRQRSGADLPIRVSNLAGAVSCRWV